ncbi:uncharacterized protein BX663DRAFT_429950 [Cokeromyces recurvatus]|uniref:uncharacterized protein n=1 Tax=Cokeromyces recurvatus TaxID=90255 RepID=UPI00221E6AC9|nr:uncharacterized protein BX663DRAFT_429950 [Cokeromyces recurvatus]KAI7905652.1 hypothetical protein BX663DRAFT_429950 [Cokeromyces recurvatus]
MLYSENPEWSDVIPVPQDDGPNPLVPIAYAKDYIIDRNPAHYTVWNYRQQVLFALNSDLQKELDYIDEIAPDQIKNYQVWHHRQVIVDRLNNGDRELQFINTILEEDPKNYHGWSYRQWVVKRFNLWEHELAFTNDLLVYDVRNNSAWNYRYYILFNNPKAPSNELIQSEIKLYEKTNKPFKEMEPFIKQLIESNTQSPFLLIAYIDIYEQNARLENKSIDPVALEMCKELAEKQDPIREKYWNFKKKMLEELNNNKA